MNEMDYCYFFLIENFRIPTSTMLFHGLDVFTSTLNFKHCVLEYRLILESVLKLK